MKRIMMIWQALSPETQKKVLDNYPWLIIAALALAAASYFTACKCREKKATPKPDAEPAPVVASLFPGAIRHAFLRADDDPAYREALKRAEQRWRERAMRRAASAAGQPCPDCCGCGRCDGPCPCLATGRVCGPGCCCVAHATQAKGMEAWKKGGVDWDKVQDERRRVLRGTREITRAEAIRLVEGDVPDDAGKLRLTIIGSEADRKKVLAALDQPPLAELKSHFVIQAYSPDDWAVKDGFVTTGTPTIYIEQPGGKTLSRQDTYVTADELLLAMTTSLRKADPNYDPKKDPDLSKKPLLPGLPDLSKIPKPVWIGGALLLLLLLKKKEGQ